MKIRNLIRQILKEDSYYQKSNDNWQYEEISDDQVSYLENLINDQFGSDKLYYYINFIDSFPESSDGSRLFISCGTDSKPTRTLTLRCSDIEGSNLEVDGSLTAHEPNTKTIFQAEF